MLPSLHLNFAILEHSTYFTFSPCSTAVLFTSLFDGQIELSQVLNFAILLYSQKFHVG